MHSEIEEFLRELNIISRFAVIENAELTEKYIHKYSNFIKYKYANISKSMIGEQAFKNIKNLLEMYSIKYNNQITYKINKNRLFDTTFLPHYCILSLLESMVKYYGDKSIPIDFAININDREIEIIPGGISYIDWNNIKNIKIADGYFSINAGKKRWEDVFGEDSYHLFSSKIILKM